jgi:hypothetical protein
MFKHRPRVTDAGAPEKIDVVRFDSEHGWRIIPDEDRPPPLLVRC